MKKYTAVIWVNSDMPEKEILRRIRKDDIPEYGTGGYFAISRITDVKRIEE